MAVNTLVVTPGHALEVLKAAWDARLKASIMLWGSPGIGKTQVVEQLVRHMGGKLYDVRLTTIDPSDLRGLPYYDHETKRTVYYRPSDLPNDPDQPAVLFLDELSSASPMLQPTVYGLLQERRVGEHRIPDNVMIIAAGNRVEDGAVAFEMGTAIADRLIHISVTATADDWLNNYAVPNDLHPAVIAYIKTRPDHLETTQECMNQGHMISTTPRSWDRVSTIMQTIANRDIRRTMIAGTIGDARCAEFMIIADDIAASVQVVEMLKKPRAARLPMYPTTLHGLNAMVFGLVGMTSKETFEAQVEILSDLRKLVKLRPQDAVYSTLPITELATNGFELFLERALNLGLEEQIATSPAYEAYETERAKLGLSGSSR